MGYLGNTPTTQSFISGTDYFNGDGSTTAFTLSRTVASVNDIEAVVNNVVQQPNSAYTLSGTTITFTSAPSAGTNNIYVRYLSTTTQSITPSQNTVSYSTMNTDMQGLFGQSFTNRIINGAMMIDQYHAGASFTPTDNTIAFDRWKYNAYQANKFTCQQTPSATETGYATRVAAGFTNYMAWTVSSAYTPTTGEYFIFNQRIEGLNVADLGWGTASAKTVTLSFWVYSSLTGTHSGAITNSGFDRSYPFSFSVSSANTWTSVNVTISGDTSGTWLTTNGTGIVVLFNLGSNASRLTTAGSWAAGNYTGVTGSVQVVTNASATFYITGVQLEKGSTATSFDYRPYGTELALCQRYYWKATSGDAYTHFAVGFVTTSTGFSVMTQLPVPMRATPTMNYSTVTVRSAAGSTAITSLDNARNSSTQWGADMSATGAGLTAGQACLVRGNNSTSAYIDASAEL